MRFFVLFVCGFQLLNLFVLFVGGKVSVRCICSSSESRKSPVQILSNSQEWPTIYINPLDPYHAKSDASNSLPRT